MTMTAAGVAKLIEECGELQTELGELVQVLGKKLAYWDADDHWDGAGPLSDRINDEMTDVEAAVVFVRARLGLSEARRRERLQRKLALFDEWEAQLDNHDHGIDASTNGMTPELRDAILLWRRNRDAPVPDREDAIDHLVIAVDRWRHSSPSKVCVGSGELAGDLRSDSTTKCGYCDGVFHNDRINDAWWTPHHDVVATEKTVWSEK